MNLTSLRRRISRYPFERHRPLRRVSSPNFRRLAAKTIFIVVRVRPSLVRLIHLPEISFSPSLPFPVCRRCPAHPRARRRSRSAHMDRRVHLRVGEPPRRRTHHTGRLLRAGVETGGGRSEGCRENRAGDTHASTVAMTSVTSTGGATGAFTLRPLTRTLVCWWRHPGGEDSQCVRPSVWVATRRHSDVYVE